MRFQEIKARGNWREKAKELGYLSNVLDDPPYWIEALEEPFCAVFTETEVVELLELATYEVNRLALEAVEEICNGRNSDQLFDRLKTPVRARAAIRASWRRGDPSLWGRLDFSYSNGKLKLLELNFDGAVSLYEASYFQLLWLEDLLEAGQLPPASMQSNSIHEGLTRSFSQMVPERETVHFTSLGESSEDDDTVRYLQSCALLAGQRCKYLLVKDLGYDKSGGLIDLDNEPIKHLVKLYPWEALFRDDGKLAEKRGKSVLLPLVESGETKFFEPIWKSLLANKGILSIMKELSPTSPWLLESAIEGTSEATELQKLPHARKPLFGMQGKNVSLVYPDQPELSVVTPGFYGREGFLIQELHPLPVHNGYHVLLGSWLIGGKPAGIGIRADLSPVTTATHCLFVPHYVEPKPTET